MTNYRSPTLNRLMRLGVFNDDQSALEAYTTLSNLKSGVVESHFMAGIEYTYYRRGEFLKKRFGIEYEEKLQTAMDGIEKEIIRARSS
ncbi:MAG: hypothetical protein V1818_01100 [Candidatus Aenigmatarchaeota archaeon]